LPYLEPKTYRIQVKVLDASTGQEFQKNLIPFTILESYYKTWWFVSMVFMVFAGLLLFYFRLKRKRANQRSQEKETITRRMEEVKLEALLSQMNPHFVFNSLNSVQYFISNQENEKAMRYLGTFSDLLRANLNHTSQPFLSLEEEIDYLKKYADLENARFNNRVEITYTIDPQLSLSQVEIPTMILQPFVENTFVHAFTDVSEAPKLDIAIAKVDHDKYSCTITDNGIGSASSSKGSSHISKGTHLVRERLSFLGYDPDTALVISYNDTGTVVRLVLDY